MAIIILDVPPGPCTAEQILGPVMPIVEELASEVDVTVTSFTGI